MKRKSKQNQYGRTMVEILGVVAIIGVLSIAGIAKYIAAMSSNKANKIVNACAMLYKIGVATNLKETVASDITYAESIGTLPSDTSELTYKADQTIIVGITNEDVCKQVQSKLGSKVTGGDCTVAVNPAIGYNLIVTFGEVTQKITCQNGGTLIESSNTCDCSGTGYEGTMCQDAVEPDLSSINPGMSCPPSLDNKEYCQKIARICQIIQCQNGVWKAIRRGIAICNEDLCS